MRAALKQTEFASWPWINFRHNCAQSQARKPRPAPAGQPDASRCPRSRLRICQCSSVYFGGERSV